MSVLETIGSIIAVLLVVIIILVFWTLLWKYFLSKLKFLREILGQNENGQSEPVKRLTNQRPSEEEARRQREERIKLRRSRKAE